MVVHDATQDVEVGDQDFKTGLENSVRPITVLLFRRRTGV